MRRSFRPVLVSISSCLIGLGAGVVAQIIHRLNYEREVSRMTEEFESQGQSPPLLADMLNPTFYPMLFALLFGFLGIMAYLLYHWFVTRRADET